MHTINAIVNVKRYTNTSACLDIDLSTKDGMNDFLHQLWLLHLTTDMAPKQIATIIYLIEICDRGYLKLDTLELSWRKG